MMFRQITDRVSFNSHLGKYFLFWCGDEILLTAANDADAIAAGVKLLSELEPKA